MYSKDSSTFYAVIIQKINHFIVKHSGIGNKNLKNYILKMTFNNNLRNIKYV